MEEATFSCVVCAKSFPTEMKLKKHGYLHVQKEQKCGQCGGVFGNKIKLMNHKRIHFGREKEKYESKCDKCPYESKPSNVKRHQRTAHNLKCDECGMDMKNIKLMNAHKKEKHHSMSCLVCGLSFNRCDNLKKHLRTHEDQAVNKATSEKTGKVNSAVREFLCDQCDFKTKREPNLKRHLNLKHKVKSKRKLSKQQRYIKKLKFLREVENANLQNKMDALVETDIEQIMIARPNMSNRDVAAFLRILKKKLPPKTFALNVRKAMEKRTNLLKAYFQTEEAEMVGKDGENVTMPITVASDVNCLIKMVCAKRNIDEDNCKVVMGVDGGQGKLIMTASIIPDGEKERRERAKEKDEKDRLKSTGAKRTLLIARADEVPECYENLEIIMSRLKLKKVHKEFSLVCDIKLIDILVGLQGCSSMYPCPYCMGCKTDDFGNATNQRGTFQKGEARTFRNIREQFIASNTKYRNGKYPSKKNLKKFFSVKHLPMDVTSDMDDIPISKLYPPPQLHCGILGPANDTLKKLESIFPVEMANFKKERHIKGSGIGGDYNGPTLKSIMSNTNGKLDDIVKIINEKGSGGEIRFAHHLKHLHDLNTMVNLKVLNLPKIKEIIQNLTANFKEMQREFKLSQTLKLHIIMDHYLDHFELTQETLLKYSDEICEAIHSQFRMFEEKHGYKNNQKNSESHKRMQHKSVVHFNSLNLGDV